MTETTPKPGLHTGVPFEEYLRWPMLSQSTLKEGRASMAHLKAAMDGEREKEVTDEMRLGSALHTCFLEPELMTERVVLWDGGARRGKEWAEFSLNHADKVILTPGYHEKLVGMVRSLRKHPEVRKWRSAMADVEVSAVGELEGIPFKGRVDALSTDPIIDLKKVGDGDPRRFQRTAYDFGYHIQGAIYCRLFNRERFVLMTVEDFPPYDVVAYEVSPIYLGRGWDEARALLERVHECMDTGCWPGRSDGIQALDEPSWLTSAEVAIS